MPHPHEFHDFAATEALRSEANRAVALLIKRRARSYAAFPERLDLFHPGLSAASPGALIEIAEHLLSEERGAARRWFGFGAEVAALNARALILLGRTRRRFPFDFKAPLQPLEESRSPPSTGSPQRPSEDAATLNAPCGAAVQRHRP